MLTGSRKDWVGFAVDAHRAQPGIERPATASEPGRIIDFRSGTEQLTAPSGQQGPGRKHVGRWIAQA
jgi:hypothetical protein